MKGQQKKPHRVTQLTELIEHRLSQAIARELELREEIIVTITKTQMSSDMRFVKAGISIYPESEQDKIFALICRKLKALKHAAFEDLGLRRVPDIKVYIDAGAHEQYNFNALLETLHKKYN